MVMILTLPVGVGPSLSQSIYSLISSFYQLQQSKLNSTQLSVVPFSSSSIIFVTPLQSTPHSNSGGEENKNKYPWRLGQLLSIFLSGILQKELRLGSPAMETTESNSLLGYGKPPWVFKGSALYQLHLVKAETARAIIPKEFKLVEAFGYTLGGFFLANYEDSPAGVFDELVVIAGIVWNPPTSCAWAARVLVSSDKACVHGREDVGLPSQVATFTKRVSAIPMTKKSRFGNFLHKIGIIGGYQKRSTTGNGMMIDIQVKEMMSNHTSLDICSINLNNTPAPKWIGPAVKLPLPSFSGRTEYNPHLLKYSCQIECRLRAVPPAKVSGPMHDEVVVTSEYDGSETTDFTNSNYKRELSISVMLSKPILALEFNSLKMEVQAPITMQQ